MSEQDERYRALEERVADLEQQLYESRKGSKGLRIVLYVIFGIFLALILLGILQFVSAS
ncbi:MULTISPECIES: hypothetical protein [Paenibacillus]|nr:MULTISPECIES: hypothetical protein [Paenibacillus]